MGITSPGDIRNSPGDMTTNPRGRSSSVTTVFVRSGLVGGWLVLVGEGDGTVAVASGSVTVGISVEILWVGTGSVISLMGEAV
jgi:hypothetical protein